MHKESFEFLKKLLETPSPSGFEQQIQKVVKRRMSQFADEIEVDVHGNLAAAFNPEGKVRVMLAGHCDQIGMMVTHIDDQGYLSFEKIGGIDPAVLPGTTVRVHTPDGPLAGVIGQKAIHLQSEAERGKKIELKQLWVDIGAPDGQTAKKLVRIGDPITFELGVTRLGKHLIAAPGCDDKVGVYVVMEALRLVAQQVKGQAKKKFPVALYAVSTVQEEIGLRGARTSCYGIDPLVGIAVDVTHATDNPASDTKRTGTVKLGEGPGISIGANVNPIIGELLLSTAKQKRIKHQPQPAPGATGTDANAMQISRAGVASALVGIPNRYMHSQVEVVDLRDLDAAAKLIAETVLRITARTSFIPV
ncbi:MAG: M42 family metallopeptidase [Bdellovibrionales bacterium]|nr:M42 family metallopeptidase [Bdellovibrionales bacterium]